MEFPAEFDPKDLENFKDLVEKLSEQFKDESSQQPNSPVPQSSSGSDPSNNNSDQDYKEKLTNLFQNFAKNQNQEVYTSFFPSFFILLNINFFFL